MKHLVMAVPEHMMLIPEFEEYYSKIIRDILEENGNVQIWFIYAWNNIHNDLENSAKIRTFIRRKLCDYSTWSNLDFENLLETIKFEDIDITSSIIRGDCTTENKYNWVKEKILSNMTNDDSVDVCLAYMLDDDMKNMFEELSEEDEPIY